MKYDAEKSFGYPVLCQDRDDYLKASFQTAFSFNINDEDPSYFKFKYRFSCGVKEIINLIASGDVSYWVKMSCRATFYSKMYEVSESGEILIKGADLRDTVEFSGYVIAKKATTLSSKKINPEFGYDSFEVANGQVLALAPPITYVTEKEFWKPISSIFEYREKEELKDNEFSVDIEEEYVQIFTNASQSQKFKQFEKSENGRILLMNTVFFAAVSKMIDAINEKPEDYRQKKWARVLEAKAAAKRVNLNDHNSFVSAQRLLDRPMSKLAEAFLEK